MNSGASVGAREVRKMLVHCVAPVGVLVALYIVLPFDRSDWWIAAIVGGGAIVAVVPLTIVRVHRLRHSDRPVVEAIEALAVLLALLILGFAAVYLTIDRKGHQFSGLNTRVDAVYFTVVTLSTVGYGDITATGQLARTIVTAQIIFDLSFVAIAVRIVVGAARDRFGSRR